MPYTAFKNVHIIRMIHEMILCSGQSSFRFAIHADTETPDAQGIYKKKNGDGHIVIRILRNRNYHRNNYTVEGCAPITRSQHYLLCVTSVIIRDGNFYNIFVDKSLQLLLLSLRCTAPLWYTKYNNTRT
jgi:hypothetical protein